MDDLSEKWAAIPGYEGTYEVSDRGRVRSLGRVTSHCRGNGDRVIKTKFLKISKNNGYLVAYLCKGSRNKIKKFYIEAALESLFGIVPKPMCDFVEDGEEWKPIPEYEGLYEVSTHGRVRSVGWYVNGGTKRRYARARLRKPNLTTPGYLKVELAVRGTIKTMSIHRLVAITFIPNPLNLPIVHHKDENKLNNRAENLEWATAKENIGDWFDRRRVVITTDTIERIGAALAAGQSTSEILSSLPRRRKSKRI
jgi:hypothetical protein